MNPLQSARLVRLALAALLLISACGAAPEAADRGNGSGSLPSSGSQLPSPRAVSPTPPFEQTPTADTTRSAPVAVSPLPSATAGALLTPGSSPPPAPTGVPQTAGVPPAPVYTYEIVNTYPHDRGAFTQGLVFEQGLIYEGTGLNGESTLRRVDLETGQVLQLHKLPEQFFGEGIAVVGDKIVQLTWKSRLGLVYDKDSFEQLATFAYPTEGWGITYDGRRLIMSDGTATLHFLDPNTYLETGRVQVHDGPTPIIRLNELEYIGGEVWANVWQTDDVARIDPGTGQVVGWINLAGLLRPEDLQSEVPPSVLNGIAYDREHGRLFVTGKRWPKLFEIALIPTEM